MDDADRVLWLAIRRGVTQALAEVEGAIGADRSFWLAERRALLVIVRAIEMRWDVACCANCMPPKRTVEAHRGVH